MPNLTPHLIQPSALCLCLAELSSAQRGGRRGGRRQGGGRRRGQGSRRGRQEAAAGGYDAPLDDVPVYAGSDAVPTYEGGAADDALAALGNSIPGVPGEDYPIYAEVPETGFSCEGQVDGGKAGKSSRWAITKPLGKIPYDLQS